MATTPTTAQVIVSGCRRLLDMRVSQFWTDADFIAEANASLCELDMILVSKFNDYKLTTVIVSATTDPVTSAQNLLALPADFLKFRGLDVVLVANSADGYLKVEPFSFKNRNAKPYPILVGPTIGAPYQMFYRVMGKSIFMLPASVASQFTYRLWYTPDYVPLVNAGDTLQPYMDSQAWYQYAIYDVAAKCQLAQDLDAAGFSAKKEELKGMIVSLATPNRDAGAPATMVDERGDWGGQPGFGWDW